MNPLRHNSLRVARFSCGSTDKVIAYKRPSLESPKLECHATASRFTDGFKYPAKLYSDQPFVVTILLAFVEKSINCKEVREF